MLRKKGVKTKKNARNTSKAVAMSSMEKMEKSFKELPAQLISQCRNDVIILKNQESKLAAALKKARELTKAIENKCAALSKAKSSAATKKQLATAKQGHKNASAAVKEMTAKIEGIKKQLMSLTDKQTKFTALVKEIAKFNKDWGKNKTRAKVTKAPKASSRKKSMPATQSTESLLESMHAPSSAVEAAEMVESES